MYIFPLFQRSLFWMVKVLRLFTLDIGPLMYWLFIWAKTIHQSNGCGVILDLLFVT